jgi:hypothetical protein
LIVGAGLVVRLLLHRVSIRSLLSPMERPPPPRRARPHRGPHVAMPVALAAASLPLLGPGIFGCRQCALRKHRRGQREFCKWLPWAACLPAPADFEFLFRLYQIRPAAQYYNALRCAGAARSLIDRARQHVLCRLCLANAVRVLPSVSCRIWLIIAPFLVDAAILCRGPGRAVFEPYGGEILTHWFWRGAAQPDTLQGAALEGAWYAFLADS